MTPWATEARHTEDRLMSYYAIFNRYGNHTNWADTGLDAGVLLRFEKRQERDTWCNDCDWQGSHKRLPTTRRSAALNFKQAFRMGDAFYKHDGGEWAFIEDDERDLIPVPNSARQWA